jgi:methylase of polypeptide subunit release factors
VQNRDGGGSVIDDLVYNYLKKTITKPKKVLELCAGPAYMGKKLYETDFCDELHVSDINAAALPDDEYITKHISDGFDNISELDFDLIVCNPPWFEHQVYVYSGLADELLTVDPKWRLHKKIYPTAKNFLTAGGYMFMIECKFATNINTFNADGLELVDHFELLRETENRNHMTTMAYGALYRKTNG